MRPPVQRAHAGSDEELLAAWKNGDTAAGQTLFDRHFAAVYRFFTNKVRTAGDADDLVQQTFLALLERAERLEAASFRAYLLGVAHHKLCAYYRGARRAEERFELGSVSAEDLGSGALARVCADEQQRQLLAALRQIPLDDQILLEMFYWEQMTGAEIAEVLKIPLGTLRNRLKAARQRLQVKLAAGAPLVALASSLAGLRTWASGVRKQRA